MGSNRNRLFLCGDGVGANLPNNSSRMMAGIFGKSFNRTRKAMGWTRAEVAKFTGISTSSLGAIERGEVSPRLDVAVKLCTLLGADIGDMITPRNL